MADDTGMASHLRCTVRSLIFAPLVCAYTACSIPASAQTIEQEGTAGAQRSLMGSMKEEAEEIREMWATYQELYNKHDADGLVSFFEEDADRFTYQGEVAHGRAEIREQYLAEFAIRDADPTIQPLDAEFDIRFLRSDLAIFDGKAVWNAETKVQFTVILSKETGRWMIAAGRPRGALQQ